MGYCKQKPDEAIIAKSDVESFCQCLLNRFDDSNDEIRIHTCSALQSFMLCLNSDSIDLYGKIIETVLIHLDDSNKQLQQHVFDFLKSNADFNTDIFEKQLDAINKEDLQSSTQTMLGQLETIVKRCKQ